MGRFEYEMIDSNVSNNEPSEIKPSEPNFKRPITGVRRAVIRLFGASLATVLLTAGVANNYRIDDNHRKQEIQAMQEKAEHLKQEQTYKNQVYKNMKALKQLMDNCKIVVDDRIQNDNREELLTLMDKDDRLKDYTSGLKRLNKMTIYQDEQENLYTRDGISYYQYYNKSVGYGGPYDEEYSEEMWHYYPGKGAAFNMMYETSGMGMRLIDLVSDIAQFSQDIFSADTISEYTNNRWYSSSGEKRTYTEYDNDIMTNRLYVKFLPSDEAACRFDDDEGRSFVKFDDKGKTVFTYRWFAPEDMKPGNVVGVCFPYEEYQQHVLETVGLSENITDLLNQFTQMRSQDDLKNAMYQFNTLRCALLNDEIRNYINEEAEKLKKDKKFETVASIRDIIKTSNRKDFTKDLKVIFPVKPQRNITKGIPPYNNQNVTREPKDKDSKMR